jgi:hypothetical protein
MSSRRIFTPMPMRVSPPKISILPDVAGSLSPMAAPITIIGLLLELLGKRSLTNG